MMPFLLPLERSRRKCTFPAKMELLRVCPDDWSAALKQ